MNKRNIEPIRSREDFDNTVKFIVERLYTTPSMVDKLPKYLMRRIDMAVEWASKHGWK